MEWARESIEIVILSMGSSVGIKAVSCGSATTLPFHGLDYILQFFTDLRILIKLRLEVLKDSWAKHSLRRGV